MFCLVVDHHKGHQTNFVSCRFCVYMIPELLYPPSVSCGISVIMAWLVQGCWYYVWNILLDSAARVTTYSWTWISVDFWNLRGDNKGKRQSHTNLHIYSIQHHTQDRFVIMKEGNCTHPRFSECDIFVPWVVLIRRQPNTKLWSRGEEWERWRPTKEETREGYAIAFRAYINTLEIMT